MGKNLNKILNYAIAVATVFVAAVYLNNLNKKSHREIAQYDQSSTGMPVDRQQEIASKYMKELQAQLKKEEIKSLENLKKIQEIKKYVDQERDRQAAYGPKEQQITKEREESFVELEKRSAASGSGSQGAVLLNKDTALEFIETARRNGYHVELSPQYEVISITPIMKKDRQDSFDTNPAY